MQQIVLLSLIGLVMLLFQYQYANDVVTELKREQKHVMIQIQVQMMDVAQLVNRKQGSTVLVLLVLVVQFVETVNLKVMRTVKIMI